MDMILLLATLVPILFGVISLFLLGQIVAELRKLRNIAKAVAAKNDLTIVDD